MSAELSRLTCHGCPVLMVLSRMSYPDFHARVVPFLFHLLLCSGRLVFSSCLIPSCLIPNCLAQAVQSWLYCLSCPVPSSLFPAVLLQNSCPKLTFARCLVLAGNSCPSCPDCPVQAELSRLTCSGCPISLSDIVPDVLS
jgi:hypothetical protein